MLSRSISRASVKNTQCFRQSSCRLEYQRIVELSSVRTRPSQRFIRNKTTITISRGATGQGGRGDQLRDAFKKHPISAWTATAIIISMLGMLGYANYVYLTYIVGHFHKFPDEVAKPLRKALYYDNLAPDPQKALKYYKDALRISEEIGMDPFSDEILGVKIHIAAFMEKNHHHEMAIQVLEVVRRDCFAYVDKLGDKHWNDGKRTRILGKTVAIGVKLGELYSSPAVDNQEAAESALVSTVETVLREKKRRERDGVKEGEGEWVTDEEAGAAFEALGQLYEAKDKHHLSAPLFLQALSLCPPKSCHAVIIMNNLASSLSQQRPPPSFAPSVSSPKAGTKSQQPLLPTPADLRGQAALWARKAISLSQSISPPNRTEECDVGCAVATHNLGEFAEMAGSIDEASKLYQEAESLAKGINFEEGVIQAREALRRVRQAEKA